MDPSPAAGAVNLVDRSPPPAARSPPVLPLPDAPTPAGRSPPQDLLPTPADRDSPPADRDLPPADLGPPPADLEPPPADLEPPPPDLEPPPTDRDSPPADLRSPPADLHPPLANLRSPPADLNPPPDLHPPLTDLEPPPDLHPPSTDLEPPPPAPPAAGSIHTAPANPTAFIPTSILFWPLSTNIVQIYVNHYRQQVPRLVLEPGLYYDAVLDPAYQPAEERALEEVHVGIGEGEQFHAQEGEEVMIGALEEEQAGEEAEEQFQEQAGEEEEQFQAQDGGGGGHQEAVGEHPQVGEEEQELQAHGGGGGGQPVGLGLAEHPDLFDVDAATPDQINDELQRRKGTVWSGAERRRFCVGHLAYDNHWCTIARLYIKTRTPQACAAFAGRQMKKPGGIPELMARRNLLEMKILHPRCLSAIIRLQFEPNGVLYRWEKVVSFL